MRETLNRLSMVFEVPGLEPAEARRAKLLNIVLLAVAASALFTLLLLLVAIPLGAAGSRREVTLLVVTGLAVLLGSAVVYGLNRHVSRDWAGTFFLLLMIAVGAACDTPEQVVSGRAVFVFTIPIITATFILRPWASYVAAAASALVVSVISLAVVGQSLPNLPVLIGFFALATVSWLSARTLERATERERTSKEALQRSEQRFRRVYEHIAVGVARVTLDGTIQGANQAYCRMLGYDEEDLTGQHLRDVTHEETRADHLLKHTRLAAGQIDHFRMEKRLIRRDGRVRDAILDASLVRDAAGAPAYILNSILDIAERKEAEAEARERTAQLEALREVGLTITAELQLDGLLRSITSRATDLLRADAGGLYLYRPGRDLLEFSVPVGPASPPQDITLERGQGLAGKVWDLGEPLTIDQYQDWEGRAAAWEDYPVASAVSVPVRWGEEFLGVLSVHTRTAHAFSSSDTELLSLFATQAAIAIRNARLYEQAQQEIAERKRAEEALRRRADELAALQATVLDITAHHDLPTLLETIVERAAHLLDAPSGGMYLCQPDREEARVVVSYNTPDDYSGVVVRYGEGAAGTVAETGEPLIIDDYRTWHRRAEVYEEEHPFTAVASAPMTWQGTVTGVINVMDDVAHRRFTQHDLELLALFANHAAIAVENARLLEQARDEIAERRRTQEALRQSEERYRLHFENVSDVIYSLDRELRIRNLTPSVERVLGYAPDELIGRRLPDSHVLAPEFAHEALADARRVLQGQRVSSIYQFIAKDGTRKWGEVSSAPLARNGEVEAVVSVARDVTKRREMEEQLRQQEQLAAVGQLAGGIAHDFNNILAAIILHAQMPLRDRDLSSSIERVLKTILEESHRAADLVQQILDFSRSAMMDTEPLSLVAQIQQAITLLRRTIPENIHLATDMEADPCIVEADATRIHQVLMNLALNAKDAMPEGGELRIAVKRLTLAPDQEPPAADMPPGAWAVLTVSDTGTGLSERVQEHLFEPFFTTKEPGKGTGLGLAQVYGIVKQHDGFIDVDTAAGEGTTFTIFLPLVESYQQEELAAKERAPLQGRGETVLVVEDAEPLRRGIKTGLESLGYRALTAANGRQALEALSQHGVDLVLTDVVMPEMGGEALLRALRGRAPHLKIIAMTGHVVETDVKGLQARGFDAALPKPFSIDELTETVRNVLDSPS